MKMTYCPSRRWQPRRVVITKEIISFAFNNDDAELDYIPLPDVEFVKLMQDLGEGRRSGRGSFRQSKSDEQARNIPPEFSTTANTNKTLAIIADIVVTITRNIFLHPTPSLEGWSGPSRRCWDQ